VEEGGFVEGGAVCDKGGAVTPSSSAKIISTTFAGATVGLRCCSAWVCQPVELGREQFVTG
jgi:hypothetical protein